MLVRVSTHWKKLACGCESNLPITATDKIVNISVENSRGEIENIVENSRFRHVFTTLKRIYI